MKTTLLTLLTTISLLAFANLGFAQSSGSDIFVESFDSAASTEGWTAAGDAAGRASEATLEWAETAGVSGSGALRMGGVNADGEGGRAYIFEKVFTDIDFGGKTNVRVSISVKTEALEGTNVFVLTDIAGSIVQRNDGIIAELNGNEFTTFTFDHTAISASANAVKVQFNLAAGAAANLGGTIFVDDIKVSENTGGGGGSSFDSGLLTNGDFELGNDGSWFGNALNILTEGGNSYNFADVAAAGNAYDVNLSQGVAIENGKTYTLKFNASTGAGTSRTLIAGIGLNEGDFAAATETITLTDQTQTFTLTLTATFGSANSRVLFDMGADVGIVVIDNVTLIEGTPPTSSEELLTNGDFELGNDGSWTGNALNILTEGDNSYNFADVATAGNAFDVNLSQVVAITSGETYTLKFDASTGAGATRTMIAGIGLNEGDFAAAVETVNLTDQNQTFTLTLTANFGSANSRVLFDMGADVGIVVIDNVSLVQGSGGSSGETSAPTTSAPTPPSRNAADVISLFSDAYTNVNVSSFATEWSEGTTASNVEVAAGDLVKMYDFVNFAGIQLENAIDLTDFTHMHFDYWVGDASVAAGAILSPKLSNHANLAGETSAIESTNPVSVAGEWVSFDVALDNFTDAFGNGVLDRQSVLQIILGTAGTLDKVYIDNMYFYKNASTNIDAPTELPTKFVLKQNYPNPFNPTTTISYSIPTAGQVQMDVFNLQGQRVATLVDRFQNAGSHVVNFDASNLASGVYTYRLISGNNVLINKMTLIK